MDENYEKVGADVSMEQLSQWLREGRLYLAPSSDELIDQAIREVMSRVGRIDGCCTEEYSGNINNVWRSVLRRRSFRRRLVMKKGKRKNEPNWYFVANIVSTMQMRGVYRGSVRSLMKQMHGGRDSGYARHAMDASYMMTEKEESSLKEILRDFCDAQNKSDFGHLL